MARRGIIRFLDNWLFRALFVRGNAVASAAERCRQLQLLSDHQGGPNRSRSPTTDISGIVEQVELHSSLASRAVLETPR